MPSLFAPLCARDTQNTCGVVYREMIGELGDDLIDVLRPSLVRENDLDALCDVLRALRHDIVPPTAAAASTPGAALAPGDAAAAAAAAAVAPAVAVLSRDCQERLIYRVGEYVAEAVDGFTPGPQDVQAARECAAVVFYDSRVCVLFCIRTWLLWARVCD
jgi:hypothetical protein